MKFDPDYFDFFNKSIAELLKRIFSYDEIRAHLASNALYDPQFSAAGCISGQLLGIPAEKAAVLFMALESIAFQKKTPKMSTLVSSFKRAQLSQHVKILEFLNGSYPSVLGGEELNFFSDQVVKTLTQSPGK